MAEISDKNDRSKSTKHEDMLADAIERAKADLWIVAPVVALLDGVDKLSDERENEVIEAMVKQKYTAIKNSRTSTKWNREFKV